MRVQISGAVPHAMLTLHTDLKLMLTTPEACSEPTELQLEKLIEVVVKSHVNARGS